MEVPGGHRSKIVICLFEFLGTAFLLYAINTSTESGMAPYGAGLTIMSNICIFGFVCGGHFNPAITLAVFIAEGRENFGKNFVYAIFITLSQICGAFAGCLFAWNAQYYSAKPEDVLTPGIAVLKPFGPTMANGGR